MNILNSTVVFNNKLGIDEVLDLLRCRGGQNFAGHVLGIELQPFLDASRFHLFFLGLHVLALNFVLADFNGIARLGQVRCNIYFLAVYFKETVVYQLAGLGAGLSEAQAEYNVIEAGFEHAEKVITGNARLFQSGLEVTQELLFHNAVVDLGFLLFLQLNAVFRQTAAAALAMLAWGVSALLENLGVFGGKGKP